MKSLLYYLLQVLIASGILYGYYHLFLRNKKFHRYNRYYLLAATVISITLPILNIPVYFSQSETDSSFVLQTLTVISSDGGEVPTAVTAPETNTNLFSWETLAILFYILISFFVLFRIIFSLLKIRRIIKTNPVEKLDNIRFVTTVEPGTPFSFFRWLFWNKKIELQSEKGEQIFRHELFHIKQKHSWDIMYLELLTVLCWINPFFRLIKKEVKAIHEFLADQFAVKENQHWEYAELLLMQVLNTKQQLVNPFFHNQIKRRIAMITTSKKPSYQYWRKLMVFPVTVLVIFLFAFTYKKKNAPNALPLSNNEIITDSAYPGYYSNSKQNGIIDTASNSCSGNMVFKSGIAINDKNGQPHPINATLTMKGFELKKDTIKRLYIINGREYPEITTIQEVYGIIEPDEIDSINVFKGQIAVSKYGDKGKNGVIEIITKKEKKNLSVVKEILSDTRKPNPEDASKIFDKVETEPSFPGGETKWKQYIKAQLNQNIPVQNGAPARTYTVIVQFVVKTDSFLTNIKALTNHGFGMEEEAIRLISKGPRWIPGLQNGKQVNAIKNQQVTFVIKKDDEKIISIINNSFPNPGDVIYIGAVNELSLINSKYSLNEVSAVISRGSNIIQHKKDKLVVTANYEGVLRISLFVTEKNEKINIGDFAFQSKVLQPEYFFKNLK